MPLEGGAGIGPASHPSRGGWIEILEMVSIALRTASHPSRGGWIEIFRICGHTPQIHVPPLTGWVD